MPRAVVRVARQPRCRQSRTPAAAAESSRAFPWLDDAKQHRDRRQVTCGQRDTGTSKAGYGAANPSLKGPELSASDPGLRRVSVHAGTSVVDLALPAAVPVATLIPSIVDILDDRDADRSGDLVAARYQLFRPGASALPASTTLAQNGIRDGAVLILSQFRTEPPASRFDDVAEAVSATLDAARRGPGPASVPADRRSGGELPHRYRRPGADSKRPQHQHHPLRWRHRGCGGNGRFRLPCCSRR